MFVEAENFECGVRTGVPSLSDTPPLLRFAGLAESSGSVIGAPHENPAVTRGSVRTLVQVGHSPIQR